MCQVTKDRENFPRCRNLTSEAFVDIILTNHNTMRLTFQQQQLLLLLGPSLLPGCRQHS